MDFANSSGDHVFDGTLRRGLAVQLEQSPFINLVSEQQVQQTLRLMKQPAKGVLTPELAREVCQRTNSTILIDGSIAQVGNQYTLILSAIACADGKTIASSRSAFSFKNM